MHIIFSSNNRPLSLLIKATTFAKYHHCGILHNGKVWEARFKDGVTTNKCSEFKSRGKWTIVNVPTTAEQDRKILEFLQKQLGKKYDLSGIFGFLFSERDWQNPEKWYCSELVATAFSYAGIPLIRKNIAGVSTRDIYILPYEIVSTYSEKLR